MERNPEKASRDFGQRFGERFNPTSTGAGFQVWFDNEQIHLAVFGQTTEEEKEDLRTSCTKIQNESCPDYKVEIEFFDSEADAQKNMITQLIEMEKNLIE